MKLLPDELLRKLEAQDPVKLGYELSQEQELVQAKFFTPDANWTWYAVSASPDPETGDVQFFGLVDGLEQELGYFWLSQLNEVRGKFGLPVERDLYWEPIPLNRLMEELERAATC
jgi:Protein of unknown function (DUF2958)